MMDPFSNPFYLLSPLAVTSVIVGLLFLVWEKGQRDFSSLIFSMFLASLGLSSLFTFLMRNSPDVYLAVQWDRAIVAAAVSSFMFYYHFTLVYASIRMKAWIVPAIYLSISVLAIIAVTTDLVISEMTLAHYGYTPVLGPLGFLSYITLPIFIIGGVYNLLKRYLSSRLHEERNRLLYLTIAVLFPLVGASLDAFSNLPPAFIWSSMIFCILCSVTILKYRLLDIRVVIRKSLVYLFVSVTIALPYVGVLFITHQILQITIEPWWIHAIVILFVAIVLRPMYTRAQQFVDRLFYRDRYDHLRALQQFSHQTQSVANLEELGLTLVKLVRSALRSSSAYLLLPSEGKDGLTILSCDGLDNPPPEIILRNESLLVKQLELHGGILSSRELNIIPSLQSLGTIERQNLENLGAELYIPIKISEGELSGILILGKKLSGQDYSNEEKQLLTVLSHQLAINLENARLYEQTKQSEQALRQNERNYKELAGSITDVFFAMDSDLRYTYWNKAYEELTGISAKDALGKRPYDLFTDVEATRRAGKVYLKVLRTKQPQYFVNEYRTGVKDFFFEISVYPSKDGLSVFAKDITERKETEERERRLQEDLNRSSRLASIGELAAGVAHELNNPLTGILGFSEILLRRSADEKTKRVSEMINNEAQRAAQVVRNLLIFARPSETKKEYSDVNDILQKTLELRAYELKTSNIKIALDLAPSLPEIVVDFGQIQQVFLNIILNAEQAMTEANKGGKLSIKTEETKGYIRLSFADDGPGIPAKYLDKLSDPFFTTRGEKGGTGLGLSVCHGIVTKHGGKIYTRSEPGKSTIFFVELPTTIEKAD